MHGPRDNELLTRGYHQHSDRRRCCCDVGIRRCALIEIGVELHAQESESRADGRPVRPPSARQRQP